MTCQELARKTVAFKIEMRSDIEVASRVTKSMTCQEMARKTVAFKIEMRSDIEVASRVT